MNDNNPVAAETPPSRKWLLSAIGLFVVSRLLLLLGPWPYFSDVYLYFSYAQQALEQHKVAL